MMVKAQSKAHKRWFVLIKFEPPSNSPLSRGEENLYFPAFQGGTEGGENLHGLSQVL
ncbi:hypothetical protein ABRG53_0134 [Pseudanabaena sp. ABRG5-3]|nr:hypothetical protein ABRG53_0134 [Pseudanabaena sp. ABRG5-3]